MDQQSSRDEDWIHLLFRGDQSSHSADEQDDYVREFSKKQLCSATVPILEFRYKHIDSLAELLEDPHDWNVCKGLILTSPRAVEAVYKATKLISKESTFWWEFKSDLVFIIGERTLKACEGKIDLVHNTDFRGTDSKALAKFLKEWLRDKHNTWEEGVPRNCHVKLIYPKSSLADDTFERELADTPNFELHSIVVYETAAIKDLNSLVIKKLRTTNIPNGKQKLILNLIFFSPSGVDGFMQLNQDEFHKSISRVYPDRTEIEFRYSSIGMTTKNALKKYSLDIYCISEKPTPASLTESLANKLCDNRVNDKTSTLFNVD